MADVSTTKLASNQPQVTAGHSEEAGRHSIRQRVNIQQGVRRSRDAVSESWSCMVEATYKGTSLGTPMQYSMKGEPMDSLPT
jgi:hypothetical protein